MLVKRARERHDFWLAKIALPLLLRVLLNSVSRVVLSPAPSNCKVECATKHLDDAIGPNRRLADLCDVAMKVVYVVKFDISTRSLPSLGRMIFCHIDCSSLRLRSAFLGSFSTR